MSWRLYVDIGNTAVKLGVPGPHGWRTVTRHENAEFVEDIELPDLELPEDEIRQRIEAQAAVGILPLVQAAMAQMPPPEALVVVCSNAQIDGVIGKVAAELGLPWRRLGKDFKHKIKSRYNLVQLGQDRLANLVAALDAYEPPLVVVDAGSCTTIDAVDASGMHLGGAILPGQRAMVESLSSAAPHLTAALQRPKLPKGFVGVNTAEALAAGIILALGGAVSHALDAMCDALGTDEPLVLLCGGDAESVEAFTGGEIDEFLTLTGLRLADEAAYPPP